MIEETTNNRLPSIDENAELEEQVILFFQNILMTYILIFFLFIYVDKLYSTRVFHLLYKNRRRNEKG